MNDKLTMTVQEIMDLGFSKWTAYNILRQAKHIMVERGFDFLLGIRHAGTRGKTGLHLEHGLPVHPLDGIGRCLNADIHHCQERHTAAIGRAHSKRLQL